MKPNGSSREVHTRAVAAGNRGMTMTALNNLGEVCKVRQGLRGGKGLFPTNVGTLPARLARKPHRPGSYQSGGYRHPTWATRRGARGFARRAGVSASSRCTPVGGGWRLAGFGNLAHAEGQTERALALLGLARHQPAWSSDDQHHLDKMLAEWALDPSVVEAGLKKGEELDWDETVKELLKLVEVIQLQH